MVFIKAKVVAAVVLKHYLGRYAPARMVQTQSETETARPEVATFDCL